MWTKHQRSTAFYSTLLICLCLLISCTSEPTSTPEPTLSVDTCHSANIPDSACSGVSINDDWTPYIETINDVEMALVPAGCFMMGSESGNSSESPVHKVCFNQPFWIDVYEVTNKQYGSSGYFTGDNQPRDSMAWADALAHCESRGARLPTEAEWEYATRGPDALVYPWKSGTLEENMIQYTSADSHTWDVGSKPGGVSWVGAYDLLGNVDEWMNDWYDKEYYSYSPETNPQGATEDDRTGGRAIRGHSYLTLPIYIWSSYRSEGSPSLGFIQHGFRCAQSFQP